MRKIIATCCILVASCAANNEKTDVADNKSIQCLQSLGSKDNFSAIPGTLYTGVKDPALRTKLNAHFKNSVDLLISAVNRGASSDQLLKIIDTGINSVDRAVLETEDAEQFAGSFEQTLDCLGIESSGGILNRWMYGFEVP